MRKLYVAACFPIIVSTAVFAFLAFCPFLGAQQVLNNESVIKMLKAGLSDDLIVSTINASPGAYDISADSVIALKAAGASDKVVSAIIQKVSSSATQIPVTAPPSLADTGAPAAQAQQSQLAAPKIQGKPRVFLQSSSKGTNRNAARDQSMEMSKDLEKNCTDVQITINQQMADYTVALNHIEVGFVRDNQIQIANKIGDLISKTKEGGSIAAGMKRACNLILEDWAKQK